LGDDHRDQRTREQGAARRQALEASTTRRRLLQALLLVPAMRSITGREPSSAQRCM
jgi:hypothetical protein